MLSLAIHSHKGGVGKSSLAVNFAIKLAKRGHRVGILDFDIGAPNLYTFFNFTPKAYLDDLFRDEAAISDIITDISDKYDLPGKLYVALTNPSGKNVQHMSTMGSSEAMQMLQASLKLTAKLKKDPYNLDFLILDTTPGLSLTTVNSFLLTNMLIFIVKFSNSDIEGTIEMITGLVEQLDQKPALLSNSIPMSRLENEEMIKNIEKKIESRILEETDLENIDILGWIPHDADLIETEFDNMVTELQGGDSRRIIHALEYDDHPLLRAMDKVLDRLEAMNQRI